MQKIILALAAIGALLLPLTSSVFALKLSPAILELQAKPGQVLREAVRITNDLEAPQTYQVVAFDASSNANESGFATYTKKTTESLLANWIAFDETKITLTPGQSKDVQFTVNVPTSAAPGGYYAMVGWESADSATLVQQGAAVTGVTGANIALDVAGNAVMNGSIAGFSTKGDITKFQRLPVDFVIRIANNGNRHFKPSGDVVIKDMLGRAVVNIPFNDTLAGGLVLPNSVREYPAQWSEGFAFGKYTAVLNASLGTAGTATALYSFWVLPTGLLVLWLVLAIIIIAILGMLIKNMMGSMKK